jgi:hypothetical protein
MNAKNNTAIGSLAVPVLRYSFGIINCRSEGIRKIGRTTRKIQTVYKIHHPKANIVCLYVKSKEGGRGLLQIEATYKAEIINIGEYLGTKYNCISYVRFWRFQNMESVVCIISIL